MKLALHIDGGSRGNPGPAACGMTMDDLSSGRNLLRAGFYLGRLTNNAAEYQGLIKALELADRLQPEEIEILSDSQLMVCQVSGQYKVKAPQLKPLFDQAMALLARFPKWSIRHVYRQFNQQADALANLALDRQADVVEADVRRLLPAVAPTPPAPAAPRPGRVLVEFTADPGGRGSDCPLSEAMDHHFAFTDVTPADMCLHAARSVLEALTGDGPIPAQIRCRRCRAPMRLTCLP